MGHHNLLPYLLYTSNSLNYLVFQPITKSKQNKILREKKKLRAKRETRKTTLLFVFFCRPIKASPISNINVILCSVFIKIYNFKEFWFFSFFISQINCSFLFCCCVHNCSYLFISSATQAASLLYASLPFVNPYACMTARSLS